jgi:membrane protein
MGRVFRTAQHALGEFFADGCPKLAASISYYTLFALFPLAILGVAVLGFVFNDGQAREQIIEGVLDVLPLTAEGGRADLEQLLREVTQGAGSASLLALLALAVSASGVMGAIRFALNTVYGVRDERPPLTGKVLDVLAVLAVGLVLLLSLGVSIVAQAAGLNRLIVGEVLPAILAFLVYLLILRVVPAPKKPLRDIWPGALIGAVGYSLAKLAFLGYVSNISTVYASLAAVIAFLLFTWLTANLFLLGAEVAHSWPLVRDGRLADDGPAEPLAVQVRKALRGTVLRAPARPDAPPTSRPRSATPEPESQARG